MMRKRYIDSLNPRYDITLCVRLFISYNNSYCLEYIDFFIGYIQDIFEH